MTSMGRLTPAVLERKGGEDYHKNGSRSNDLNTLNVLNSFPLIGARPESPLWSVILGNAVTKNLVVSDSTGDSSLRSE